MAARRSAGTAAMSSISALRSSAMIAGRGWNRPIGYCRCSRSSSRLSMGFRVAGDGAVRRNVCIRTVAIETREEKPSGGPERVRPAAHALTVCARLPRRRCPHAAALPTALPAAALHRAIAALPHRSLTHALLVAGLHHLLPALVLLLGQHVARCVRRGLRLLAPCIHLGAVRLPLLL